MEAFVELFCAAVGIRFLPRFLLDLVHRIYAFTSGDNFQVKIMAPGHSLQLSYGLDFAFAH